MHEATVALHAAQTTEMTGDGRHHPRNSGDGFQENRSIQYFVLRDAIVAPTGGGIKDTTNNLHRLQGQSIREIFGLPVRDVDIQVFGCIRGMGLSINIFGGAIAVQNGMFVSSFFFTRYSFIQCLNELRNGHTRTTFSGVKEFSEFHNFFVGERRLMLLEEICQIVGINASIVIHINFTKLRFNFSDSIFIELFQRCCDGSDFSCRDGPERGVVGFVGICCLSSSGSRIPVSGVVIRSIGTIWSP
mmetsp:Transcript_27646/g.64933  ORF Transcript_27646/g.64933 Transcript_27646/m.64933 type:complete len:245 (-) Transcript_27646:278-1012(-)